METIKATVLKHTDNHMLISYRLNPYCTEGAIGYVFCEDNDRSIQIGSDINIPSNPIRGTKTNVETGEVFTTKSGEPLTFLRWQ